MATTILGLDIGGANLKAATADKRAISVPFPLWKQPERLSAALTELVGKFPDSEELAVTMTGELCDCFETKRDGVAAIIKAVRGASGGRPIRVWSTDGVFLNSEEAKQNHLKVAAANWHALATYAGSYVPEGRAILVDVGSTTTDVIPILDGVPVPKGKTDYDRLFSGELLYTGVRRTPVCRGSPWYLAAELFATTLDIYLTLGMIPEDLNDRDTADGRPATRKHARARLARMFCADADMVPEDHFETLAANIHSNQVEQLQECLHRANGRLNIQGKTYTHESPSRPTESPLRPSFFDLLSRRLKSLLRPAFVGRKPPIIAELIEEDETAYIVSGSGEFLAQRAIHGPHHTSLNDTLGPEVSACCAGVCGRGVGDGAAAMIVVKVGGSLFDHPGLGPALREFVAGLAPAEVLLVPGGGSVADAVRQLDQVHGLGEEIAHWLALRSLGVTAQLLLRLLSWPSPLAGEGGGPSPPGEGTLSETCPHSSFPVCALPLTRLEDSPPSPARGEGEMPTPLSFPGKGVGGLGFSLLDAFTFAQEDESRSGALPHSWSVTTDSIAARAAIVYRAERLILLKSVDIPPETSWETAAANGWVDAHFPQIATTLTCPISVINFRHKLETHA